MITLIFIDALLLIFYIYLPKQNKEKTSYECGNLRQYDQQMQCWIDSIKGIIQHDGIHTAFDVISKQFLNEPSFKRSCNQILHEVGHWTYHHIMENNMEFIMPPNITLCAHGFDRAFVHELTSTTGDFSKAREFCTDPQLASESPEAIAGCVHGIGHGALSFYGPRMVNEGQTLIAQALEKCTEISNTSLELDYCTGGVFSEVVRSYQTNSYGLSLDEEDPFSFCREQADSYKRMCYSAAKPLLLWLTNGDFSKAASFVENIVEDTYAIAAIDSLATSVTMRNIGNNIIIVDYVNDIFACRELQERLRQPCIGGLAIELLTHSGYADALAFCRLPVLMKEERDACFIRIVPNLYEWTPKDEIQQVCSSLEEKYKEWCRY